MPKKKIVVDSDAKTISSLSRKTIEKMAKATSDPELFKAMMEDFRRACQESKKVDTRIDTDAFTFSNLSEKTINKMISESPNPQLLKLLFSDLRKAAKSAGDKSPNKRIFWSWSVK